MNKKKKDPIHKTNKTPPTGSLAPVLPLRPCTGNPETKVPPFSEKLNEGPSEIHLISLPDSLSTKPPLDPQERRILLLDKDFDSLEIIAEALRWEEFQIQKIQNRDEIFQHIHSWSPHLVLLDVDMDTDHLNLLKKIKSQLRFLSMILLSRNGSSEAIIQGLDAGADDYITKPFNPLELLARVKAQLRIQGLTEQLRIANGHLKELVDRDDLTGLFNMRSFYDRLQFELDRAKRFHRQVVVVMMDMDYFKTVNDGHDHLFGSFVLSEVGKIIKSCVRSIDISARYGGDEFLIVLTETNYQGAYQFCERLRRMIEENVFQNGKDQIQLTTSLGFAITPPHDHSIDPKSLVRMADKALYEAKRMGRNRTRFQKVAS